MFLRPLVEKWEIYTAQVISFYEESCYNYVVIHFTIHWRKYQAVIHLVAMFSYAREYNAGFDLV